MGKARTIVFGAGGTGRRVYKMIRDTTNVLFFVDNDCQKWGGKCEGLEIKSPEVLKDISWHVNGTQ